MAQVTSSSVDVQTFPKGIAIAMATSSTPWAFAVAIAPLTSTEMVFVTMQKSPVARSSQPATMIQPPQTTMAAVQPSTNAGLAEAMALPMATVTATATVDMPDNAATAMDIKEGSTSYITCL